jgi:hypothetical protein
MDPDPVQEAQKNAHPTDPDPDSDPDPQHWFLVVPINACRDPEHRAAEEGEPGGGAAAPGCGADPGPPPRL